MKKIILALAALSLSSSAIAMGIRPADPATQPVPPAELSALYSESDALNACLATKTYVARDLANMHTALMSANSAANESNYAQFSTERDIFHTELAALKAKYGC